MYCPVVLEQLVTVRIPWGETQFAGLWQSVLKDLIVRIFADILVYSKWVRLSKTDWRFLDKCILFLVIGYQDNYTRFTSSVKPVDASLYLMVEPFESSLYAFI